MGDAMGRMHPCAGFDSWLEASLRGWHRDRVAGASLLPGHLKIVRRQVASGLPAGTRASVEVRLPAWLAEPLIRSVDVCVVRWRCCRVPTVGGIPTINTRFCRHKRGKPEEVRSKWPVASAFCF
eukprot:6215500-Pyramimonas_sp.AAC.1